MEAYNRLRAELDAAAASPLATDKYAHGCAAVEAVYDVSRTCDEEQIVLARAALIGWWACTDTDRTVLYADQSDAEVESERRRNLDYDAEVVRGIDLLRPYVTRHDAVAWMASQAPGRAASAYRIAAMTRGCRAGDGRDPDKGDSGGGGARGYIAVIGQRRLWYSTRSAAMDRVAAEVARSGLLVQDDGLPPLDSGFAVEAETLPVPIHVAIHAQIAHDEAVAWVATANLLGPDVTEQHKDVCRAAFDAIQVLRRAHLEHQPRLHPPTDDDLLSAAARGAWEARPVEPWTPYLEAAVRRAVRSWADPGYERHTGYCVRAPRALAALLSPETADEAIAAAMDALATMDGRTGPHW